MTLIEDEHIVAALYNLKGWTKFTTAFMDSIYKPVARALSSKQIIWRCHADIAQLSKKFPNHFKFENERLECIKKDDDLFLTFLASLPTEQQRTIASVLGAICSE